MLDDDVSAVRQGFLCPFCFDDLGDVNALQAHVEVKHPEGGALEDSIDQIKKGILSHARKIKWTASTLLDAIPSTSGALDGRASSSTTSASSLSTPAPSGPSDKRSPPQQPAERRAVQPLLPKPVGRLGIRRSLMDGFRESRDAAAQESAVRTNMLIIRLDRLINECPADPSSRKAYERTIVPWTADSSVSLCAACAAKFSLTRRRHHCRLCGDVVCSSCSRFLSYLSARKLTNPALAAQMLAALSTGGKEESEPLASLEPAPLLPGQTGAKAAAEALGALAKRSSGQLLSLLKSAKETIEGGGADENEEGSVRSLQSQDAAEHLRVCPSCIGFLSRREAQMEGCVPPSFVSLYDQLRVLLMEVTNLFPSYALTAESLRHGETLYTLSDAQSLQRKLVMKQKDIDTLSRKIADDVDEAAKAPRPDGAPVPAGVRLRESIRRTALLELQPIIALPPLPTKEEYERLKERKKAEVARAIAESRSRREEAQRDARSKPLSASPSMPSMAGSGGGGKREERRGGGVEKKEGLARSSSMQDGWSAEQRIASNPFIEEAERDLPQIENWRTLRSQLQQAVAAGRADEARSLEEMLRQFEEQMLQQGIDLPTD